MVKKITFLVFVVLTVVLLSSNLSAAQSINVSSGVDTAHVVQKVEAVNEAGTVEHELPATYMVLPFIILLLMIATGPLFYHHFWEHHYPKVSIVLGLITVLYYIFYLHNVHSLIHTSAEYISFIALLGSLFVASGSIYIKVDKKATPWLNVVILFIGALLANVIGTTGASMLLIRPFLKVNQKRIKAYQIIFFIFLISNIGGALTPIGDPPLFIGFLKGVDFFWFVQNIWHIWLPTVIFLLIIFYIIDSRNKEGENEPDDFSGKIEVKGSKNVIYLLVILISVFIDPNVMSWVPSFEPIPIGIREIIMFSVMYLAFKNADDEVLKANEFDFEPIKEVAYLFVGIFATMIPALQLIAHEAHVLGNELNAGVFFWSTGILSGFLDNTPTFMNFLSAAMGKFGFDINSTAQVLTLEHQHALYLEAISVGAVFFGALSYIGNGPNFMVKSITERAGVKMPSFFAYMIKYSIPILIPTFFLIWVIFYLGAG